MDVNRILISSVQIKNFRSIRNETLKVNNFNIFVGLNDAGKSNFLKPLNLFFNNQTDYNTPFNFSIDFSFLFPKKDITLVKLRL
ncbi:AAA family ATPase [Clostridium sp. KNHs205]|uniref:AAA family ATPase n=1 Tax=Clostridium sp. KNHs205 TaxID=1449050 RepID=UPI00051BC398|nr:AAA family ATPase [Clostridium sp. KNHs205]